MLCRRLWALSTFLSNPSTSVSPIPACISCTSPGLEEARPNKRFPVTLLSPGPVGPVGPVAPAGPVGPVGPATVSPCMVNVVVPAPPSVTAAETDPVPITSRLSPLLMVWFIASPSTITQFAVADEPVGPVGPMPPVGPVGPGTVLASPVGPVGPVGPCGTVALIVNVVFPGVPVIAVSTFVPPTMFREPPGTITVLLPESESVSNVPCGPVGPVGPGTLESAPVGPVGPGTTLSAPVGPVGPGTVLAGPVGPVGPGTVEAEPVGPVGPGTTLSAPVGPVGPGTVEAAPVGPCNST